ncbi:MAG: hypothetical protein EX263_04795 [Flavobacteriaceae bacterium]|nr:MAG: hypothetical protein EX263_04795 [Flavobacteriaceae bacterium]
MMKCHIQINEIKTINSIDGFWSTQDYIQLLEAFNFPDAESGSDQELLDLLYLAITDFDPDEAAEIMLKFKLSDKLSEGQIKNLAHEMIEDNVAEEYSDIALHFQLFNINQLLHKAYNGTFPNAKASRISLALNFVGHEKTDIDEALILKAISNGLSDRNLIKRLFEPQIKAEVEFPEAKNIVWHLKAINQTTFEIITSDYWLNKEDFESTDFEGPIHEIDD